MGAEHGAYHDASDPFHEAGFHGTHIGLHLAAQLLYLSADFLNVVLGGEIFVGTSEGAYSFLDSGHIPALGCCVEAQ